MEQLLEFPTKHARDAFMEEVNEKYSKDYYHYPVKVSDILGWGSPGSSDSVNARHAYLDLSLVSDAAAVGQLMRFFGGRPRK